MIDETIFRQLEIGQAIAVRLIDESHDRGLTLSKGLRGKWIRGIITTKRYDFLTPDQYRRRGTRMPICYDMDIRLAEHPDDPIPGFVPIAHESEVWVSDWTISDFKVLA